MLLSDKITIPVALQLVVDDVGWMIGRDRRWEEEPSRTGMPRRHVLNDYVMLNELGRKLDMKIKCPFVAGEWDKNNILRRVPHSSRFGADWDSSLYLNEEDATVFRDYINAAEYIEVAVHGLLHDVWNEGKLVGGCEFFFPEGFVKGAPDILAPEKIIRQHLDAYMEIYRAWGFTKALRSFVSPGGAGDKESWKTGGMAGILADYGILYWCNFEIHGCYVIDGVIINDKMILLAPWEAYDIDPDILPDYNPESAGIIGSHWPNYLRYNPEKNLDNLEAWTRFFKRQGEQFGIILSKDIEFASFQQLYRHHSKLRFNGSECIIDLSEADGKGAAGSVQPLYISIKNGFHPVSCCGGMMTKYETHKHFTNYKVMRTKESIIRITFAT